MPEGALDGLAHAEPVGEHLGDLAARSEMALRPLPSGRENAGEHTQSPRKRLPRPREPNNLEQDVGGASVVEQRQLRPGRQLVPELARNLMRVAGAAHEAKQRHVVHVAQLLLGQAGSRCQAEAEQAATKLVLERLPVREVGGERQRGDDLRQADRAGDASRHRGDRTAAPARPERWAVRPMFPGGAPSYRQRARPFGPEASERRSRR